MSASARSREHARTVERRQVRRERVVVRVRHGRHRRQAGYERLLQRDDQPAGHELRKPWELFLHAVRALVVVFEAVVAHGQELVRHRHAFVDQHGQVGGRRAGEGLRADRDRTRGWDGE